LSYLKKKIFIETLKVGTKQLTNTNKYREQTKDKCCWHT